MKYMYLIGLVWLLVFILTYNYWKGLFFVELTFFVGMIVIVAGIFWDSAKEDERQRSAKDN